MDRRRRRQSQEVNVSYEIAPLIAFMLVVGRSREKRRRLQKKLNAGVSKDRVPIRLAVT